MPRLKVTLEVKLIKKYHQICEDKVAEKAMAKLQTSVKKATVRCYFLKNKKLLDKTWLLLNSKIKLKNFNNHPTKQNLEHYLHIM